MPMSELISNEACKGEYKGEYKGDYKGEYKGEYKEEDMGEYKGKADDMEHYIHKGNRGDIPGDIPEEVLMNAKKTVRNPQIAEYYE